MAKRVVEDRQGKYFLTKGNISVNDVLKCLDKGMSNEDIFKKYPDLNEGDLHVCKVWAVMVMENRPEYIQNKSRKNGRNNGKHPPVKILFDENLSWKIIPEIINNISEVSHVALEGMDGAKDIELWNRFKTDNGRSVIITRDNDFVRLSEAFHIDAIMKNRSFRNLGQDLTKNPLVVHVGIPKQTGKKHKGNNTSLSKEFVIAAFRMHSKQFVKQALRKKPDVAYMEISRDGLFKGQSLPEIFLKYTNNLDVNAEELSSPEAAEKFIKDLDFKESINWKGLNNLRKSVEINSVSDLDYEPA